LKATADCGKKAVLMRILEFWRRRRHHRVHITARSNRQFDAILFQIKRFKKFCSFLKKRTKKLLFI